MRNSTASLEVSMEFKLWLKNLTKITCSRKNDYLINKTFKGVLTWIYKTEYRGGCHDTSAALFMLLSEQGIDSKLCIGEVKIDDTSYFDHSWVEIDGLILDASVCMPNIGIYAFPPVYASQSLSMLGEPLITYGALSPVGFDEKGMLISSINLSDYSLGNAENPNILWDLTKILSKEIGLRVNAGKLKKKYGAVKRSLIRE